METIKIGSRKSLLATWQARYIASQLEAKGMRTELVLMDTKGDKIQHVAISKIGSKGVFTEELETMLSNGAIDIAVHSAKDLQSELPDGFKIIAYSKRESVHDVIISESDINLQDDSLVLGTSSTRRTATLKYFYPHIKTADMRGNLQTRISKMQSGACDGLVLASAGVLRMDYGHLIKINLPMEEFVPPVGQGALAVEAHESLSGEKMLKIRSIINDVLAEKQLIAERAFLKTIQGGCSVPVFGHATIMGDSIQIKGGILSLDGKQRIFHKVTGIDGEKVGRSLAEKVLDDGGAQLLADIKKLL